MSDKKKEEDEKKLGTGAILGIIIGSLVAIGIIFVLIQKKGKGLSSSKQTAYYNTPRMLESLVGGPIRKPTFKPFDSFDDGP